LDSQALGRLVPVS